MDYSGEDIISADLLGEEINRCLEKRLDFLSLLPFEEVGAGSD